MKPDFKQGDQVLVSTLNFNNLKGPKKMSDSSLGHFTLIKLIDILPDRGVEVPSRNKNPTPPEKVEVEDSPGLVKKIIKAKKIRLNGQDKRQYLVRFKNQTADKDKWLAYYAIAVWSLHLRGFRASRRTDRSHK
ncbi:hypothetical protein O181_019946 [Austropuccinia psidii MF-1]|uniref:Chromo domain-containing protein n=1 Tax=Austropuccinia psidii MF-1 TaxID=1389203 RepID=A0A9Q3CCJ9_9BASI|nr:hypothetical protein [Austropuccinia psidii MF-1]